jgi:hypothetical protein
MTAHEFTAPCVRAAPQTPQRRYTAVCITATPHVTGTNRSTPSGLMYQPYS